MLQANGVMAIVVQEKVNGLIHFQDQELEYAINVI